MTVATPSRMSGRRKRQRQSGTGEKEPADGLDAHVDTLLDPVKGPVSIEPGRKWRFSSCANPFTECANRGCTGQPVRNGLALGDGHALFIYAGRTSGPSPTIPCPSSVVWLLPWLPGCVAHESVLFLAAHHSHARVLSGPPAGPGASKITPRESAPVRETGQIKCLTT